MKSLKQFLLFCSGAYPSLLKRSPTEINKYLGIGGSVLFTAVFAGIAAGYAFFTISGQLWITLLLALVWALMIFNLDRFIVSTMRKSKNPWKEIKMALPRLVLALLLAVVIAKPLELKIFEREITRQIDRMRLVEIQEGKTALEKGFPEILDLEEKIAVLNAEIAAKRAFRDAKQVEYDEERFGIKSAGTSGLIGLGINAQKKEAQLDQSEKDYLDTRARNEDKIDSLEREIFLQHHEMENEWQVQKASMDGYDGLAAQLDALGTLVDQNDPIYWANFFILLLFILIETAPVLVKLLADKGPYDVLMERYEEGIYLSSDEKWYKLKRESSERLAVFDATQPDIRKHKISESKKIWATEGN